MAVKTQGVEKNWSSEIDWTRGESILLQDHVKDNSKICILNYKRAFLGYETTDNYGESLIKELRKGKGL